MTNGGASEGSRIPSQGHCCLPEGPDECRLVERILGGSGNAVKNHFSGSVGSRIEAR
jgi:hypothetical protein